MNNKVYIVVGVFNGDNVYSILSRYAVKSTLEDAKEELKLIEKEITSDYEDNGMSADWLTFKHGETSLKVIYGNDYEETYTIEERIIDYGKEVRDYE